MVLEDMRMLKGQQTRANIVYTAIVMIAESGLHVVSAAKLAEAAGVSKSTIFHHFKSNEELLTSTLNVVFDELLQVMKIGNYRDVEHFLHTLGHAMISVSDDARIYMKAFLSFFHEGMFNPNYREILTSYAEQMNDMFYTQLTLLTPESVNRETIHAVSRLILPMIDGIGIHFMLNKDRERFEEIWKWHVKGILKLLNHPV